MKINKKVYINNFNTISCAGNNAIELFDSICNKRDTISLDSTYINDKVFAIGKINSKLEFTELLFNCCKEILKESNLKDFSDTLLVVGSSVGGMANTEKIFFNEKNYTNIDYKKHSIDSIAYFLKEHFLFYDDISISTACTSSSNALGYAKEVIEKNIYKNVLVIGVDSLSYTTVCGFSALGVLSSSPCLPFDKKRAGMNVSEGIACLLLQDKKQNKSVELCGVGYSSDGHHMTQPHPKGDGAIKAMQNAILNANININNISYINAHGTGTHANDSVELNAIEKLFSDATLKVSSTKSITGHTLGASGAIEAIISCMVLQNQIIPPNKDLTDPEDTRVIFSQEIIKEEVMYVLSNSFAFGGNNTSLVFGMPK